MRARGLPWGATKAQAQAERRKRGREPDIPGSKLPPTPLPDARESGGPSDAPAPADRLRARSTPRSVGLDDLCPALRLTSKQDEEMRLTLNDVPRFESFD